MAMQQINREIPIPMFYQLKTILLSDIESGKYAKGAMIPTEAELSEMFGISRTTVRQAVLELVQQGYLRRIKGKGTFVSRPKIMHNNFIQKIEGFYDEITRLGMTPSTEVLECVAIDPPEDVVENLGLKPGEKTVLLHRKRCADGEPIVVIKTYLPYSSCGFILDHDMETNQLYKLLATRPDTEVCNLVRRIEASEATDKDRKYLNMTIGKPIHFFTTVGYARNGTPIEYSLARYRGDRNRFEVHIELAK